MNGDRVKGDSLGKDAESTSNHSETESTGSKDGHGVDVPGLSSGVTGGGRGSSSSAGPTGTSGVGCGGVDRVADVSGESGGYEISMACQYQTRIVRGIE